MDEQTLLEAPNEINTNSKTYEKLCGYYPNN